MSPSRNIAVRFAPAGIALALLLAAAACNGDDNSVAEVDVTLAQFYVAATPLGVREGEITFHVTNAGTIEHEFVVVLTNLLPGSLPTEPDGSYSEDGPGTAVVDEVEDILPGESRDLTVFLPAGNYVLLCNMVGPAGAHYSLGMRTGFSVH